MIDLNKTDGSSTNGFVKIRDYIHDISDTAVGKTIRMNTLIKKKSPKHPGIRGLDRGGGRGLYRYAHLCSARGAGELKDD